MTEQPTSTAKRNCDGQPSLAPATCYTERELLKLSNAELRSILKKLKITGWLQANKFSMARQIVFRTEQRAKFQKLSALYNIRS
jgi:hypothetical protein